MFRTFIKSYNIDHYTTRDIYYKDVPLFKSQKIVDSVKILIVFCHSQYLLVQLVDDIAATFDLERSDLNIVETRLLCPPIILTFDYSDRLRKG